MSKPTFTPRGFTNQIKKALKLFDLKLPVKSETLSFSGFGFGSACCAVITCQDKLPYGALDALRALEATFCNSGVGPEFS